MLCHGGCGTVLTPENQFTRTLEQIARQAGVHVLALEEGDLRNGNLCEDCALFKRAVGEKWQPYAYTLRLLRLQQSRVRIVDGKILLPSPAKEVGVC